MCAQKLDESFVLVNNEPEAVLEYTDLEEIPMGVSKLRDSFHKLQKTHSVQFRLNQLRDLYFAIKDNEQKLVDAIQLDFYRSKSETRGLEVNQVLSEIIYTMANLHKWVVPQKVTDVPLNLKRNPVYIERIPLGVILVMGAYNYPLFVTLTPLIGAIAAGNCVVLKPSEQTPRSSKLLIDILTNTLDPDIFYGVNGSIEETTKLLEQKFDKIVFTGSTFVGTIIAKKAAETLTPVILELGGKSPAFVLEDVEDKDLPTIANRIIWGRFTNGGQTCIAVDYVYVHKSIKQKLVVELVKGLKERFYKGLNETDTNFTHMINDRNFASIKNIINTTKGNIVAGGKTDAKSRFIEPTIIDNVNWNDSCMINEIFGPILPILEYDNLSDAVSRVVNYHDTPLALYIFTSANTSRSSNPQIDEIRRRIRSGGTMVNDVLLQGGLKNAPFGGVGRSGTGNYRGQNSYRAFTHERTTIEQKLLNERQVSVRYPPYNPKKDRVLQIAQTDYNGSVWFGRKGNVKIDGPSRIFKAVTKTAGVVALVYAFTSVL